jgi:hypothetical protein
MSHKNQKWIVRISRRIGIRKVLCFFAIAGVAEAQQVIVQPPQYSVPPPALQEAQNNETQVFNPATAFLNMLQEINPYKWGPVSFRPSVSYSFLYATGVQSSPGTNAATITQTISPNFLFIIGSHWALNYSPTWTFYTGGQFQNTLSHTAMLSWGTSYEDWVLGFSQGYTRSDTPLIETGEQTEQENYATALNASYQFNDKMSLDMMLNQNLNYVANGGSSTNVFQNLENSYNWSTMEWLNYEFWPRLNAGIGAGVGYTIQQGSPNSINEQYQGRVNWRATDKISFQMNGGVEDQQYLSGGEGDLLTPTFGACIQYQPFEHTQLSLNANRSVSPSLFQNQDTESTSLTATLNQRLLGQFNLALTGGYTTTSYVATTAGFSVDRSDDNYSFTASLSHSLTKRGTISASYSYNDNGSNVSGFAFSSNQIGVQIGYQF